MAGTIAADVRRTVSDDTDLRISLKTAGWNPELPAIQDENGVVLVGNRRLKIAAEENITPVVKTISFGTGPEAEAERVRLAAVSNVGAAPLTKADRGHLAERLYKSGLTMEEIGAMLGVSQQTVSLDLSFNLPSAGKLKRAKTPTNPKGAGRPAGSGRKPANRKTTPDTDAKIAAAVLDEGKKFDDVEAAFGVSNTVVRRAVALEEGRRQGQEEKAAIATLSPSQRERVDTALRQYKRELERRFEDEVRARYVADLNRVLPEYQAKMAEYDLVIKSRRGIMPRATFRKILACLHPDRGMSEQSMVEAFNLFEKLERLLVAETEAPTPPISFPSNYSELMELKRRAAEARRTRRSGAVAARN